MKRLLIVGADGHGRSVAESVLAVGEFQAAGIMPAMIVHPRETISPSAIILAGLAVMAGAIVGTGAAWERGQIGRAHV